VGDVGDVRLKAELGIERNTVTKVPGKAVVTEGLVQR